LSNQPSLHRGRQAADGVADACRAIRHGAKC
jgi:hypothetical protein